MQIISQLLLTTAWNGYGARKKNRIGNENKRRTSTRRRVRHIIFRLPPKIKIRAICDATHTTKRNRNRIKSGRERLRKMCAHTRTSIGLFMRVHMIPSNRSTHTHESARARVHTQTTHQNGTRFYFWSIKISRFVHDHTIDVSSTNGARNRKKKTLFRFFKFCMISSFVCAQRVCWERRKLQNRKWSASLKFTFGIWFCFHFHIFFCRRAVVWTMNGVCSTAYQTLNYVSEVTLFVK